MFKKLSKIWTAIYWLAYVLNKLGDFITAVQDAYKAYKGEDDEDGQTGTPPHSKPR